MPLRRIPALLTLLSLAIAGVACDSDGGADWDGRELHIYNWEDYIAPTTIPDFAKEYGVKVTLDTFVNENELMSSIASNPGRYDLFIASNNIVGEMAELRLVAKLNKQAIPNLANLDPRFLNLPGDPQSDYGIPYDWGTTGILYDTKCVQPRDKSWALLRDPSLTGRVAMDIDPNTTIGATLKSLSYPLNSKDPGQVRQVVDALQDQLTSGQLQLVDISVEAREMVKTGALCATLAYNGDAAHDMATDKDLAFFVPREGSDLYVDEMAIPRDAPNKDVAELFINYVLRPEIDAAISDYVGYASPNIAAIDKGLIAQETLSDPTRYPKTGNLEPWVVSDAARKSLWNQAWADIQGSVPASQVSGP